jgi:hypothetical protein
MTAQYLLAALALLEVTEISYDLLSHAFIGVALSLVVCVLMHAAWKTHKDK